MSWRTSDTGKTLKSVIGVAAPAIATALGSPIAGMAVAALSKAFFGNETESEENILKEFEKNPQESYLKLKEIESGFSTKMAGLGINLEALYLADVQNARAMNITNAGDEKVGFLNRNIVPLLSISIFAGFFTVIGVLMFVNIDTDAKSALDILCGCLQMAFAANLQFWFGSSKSSKEKDKFLKDGFLKK